jgi:competence ComEA-like helix-hairpin-helix protein
LQTNPGTGDGRPGTKTGLQGGTFESWFKLPGTPRRDDDLGAREAMNRASFSTLAVTPGVGVAMAQAIVAARTARRGGRFTKFDDLLGVGGIDAEQLEQIKKSFTLN